MERNTRLRAELGPLRRRDLPAVPPVALREALINAVVHADYAQRGGPTRVAVFDDRVVIENPGILLPGLTLDELRGGVSRLRNHVIGRTFKELGLIEQWGSGIQRMSAACLAAGLPPPELEELGLRFRVTLRTVPVGPTLTDEVERRLLDFLDSPAGRSTAELAAHLGRTARATQQRLARLLERGLVVVVRRIRPSGSTPPLVPCSGDRLRHLEDTRNPPLMTPNREIGSRVWPRSIPEHHARSRPIFVNSS